MPKKKNTNITTNNFEDPTEILQKNENVKRNTDGHSPLSSVSMEVDTEKLEKYNITLLVLAPTGLHTIEIKGLMNIYMVQMCREALFNAETILLETKEPTSIQISYISEERSEENGYPTEITCTFSQVIGIQHDIPKIVSISEKL